MKIFKILSLSSFFLGFSLCTFSQVRPDTLLFTKLLDKSKRFGTEKPDSAIFYGNKALDYSQKSNLKKQQSHAYQQLGRLYESREDYTKATENFLKAIKIDEELGNKNRIADLNDEMGIIYYIWEKFEKSMAYFQAALPIYLQQRDSLNIAKIYGHIGLLHGSREYCENRTVKQKRVDYNTAIAFQLKSLGICQRNNFPDGISKACINLASVYNRLEKPEIALQYELRVLNYYSQKKDSAGINDINYSLGETYRRLKQFDRSLKCLHSVVNYSLKHNQTGGIQFVYGVLAQVYDDARDYKSSLRYYIKYMTLRDSIYNNEKSVQTFELETRYQNEKKEKAILALTLEKEKKQMLQYSLMLLLLIVVLSALLIIYRIRSKSVIAGQKNKINEQKIAELEKEKQLVALNAVLHGEETERSRMARDLHDGLGGLLSGVKLTLFNMKGNVVLSPESVELYDRVLGMLDFSIQELRRVAHNMMPEALVKFGLKDALRDFCDSIKNNQVQVKFLHYGVNLRFDTKIEISLYRIAQELINNALKHSGAADLIIQLIQDESRINLSVQDNGKGFDTSVLLTSKGAGIANIKSRVESLNGMFDLYSEPDKGTEVIVEFKL